MVEESQKTISYYFAGASLAFGLPLLLLEILGLAYSLNMDRGIAEPWFNLIYLGLHLMSAALSGVLVGRRSSENWFRVGGVTGLLAYLLQQIIYLIFYGTRAIGDIYALSVLLTGCLIGAFIGGSFMQAVENEDAS